MAIDPNNLSGTATLTFNDDFNSLNLRQNGAGVWDTKFEWGAANGESLGDQKNWYINADDAATKSIQPWSVSNGVLDITAAQTPADMKGLVNGAEYTSGILMTVHSFTQTYGYFEMRAELPAGQGTWPAFWLLPANGAWPPEIDVMEQLGKDNNTYYTTAHTTQTGEHTMDGHVVSTSDLTTGYHTYGVDWEADKITWYFDGSAVYQSATPSDMHQPMYMLVNLGVGGNWPGDPSSSAGYSETMHVDYIRAFSDNPNATPAMTHAAETSTAPAPVETAPATNTASEVTVAATPQAETPQPVSSQPETQHTDATQAASPQTDVAAAPQDVQTVATTNAGDQQTTPVEPHAAAPDTAVAMAPETTDASSTATPAATQAEQTTETFNFDNLPALAQANNVSTPAAAPVQAADLLDSSPLGVDLTSGHGHGHHHQGGSHHATSFVHADAVASDVTDHNGWWHDLAQGTGHAHGHAHHGHDAFV